MTQKPGFAIFRVKYCNIYVFSFFLGYPCALLKSQNFFPNDDDPKTWDFIFEFDDDEKSFGCFGISINLEKLIFIPPGNFSILGLFQLKLQSNGFKMAALAALPSPAAMMVWFGREARRIGLSDLRSSSRRRRISFLSWRRREVYKVHRGGGERFPKFIEEEEDGNPFFFCFSFLFGEGK